MKGIVNITLLLLSLIIISALTLPSRTESSTLGVFVGSSPCVAVVRPQLNIPQLANCELIKWRLTLYHDARTLAPTTYELDYAFGLPEQGTNGLSQGGTKATHKGKWAIVSSTKKSPAATVYRLEPEKSRESLSFLRVDQNVIHLLDQDENLIVGNAGWSYTLNNTAGYRRLPKQAHPLSTATPVASTTSAALTTPDSSIVGTFVGRSPCREVARQLNKVVDTDCTKAKWELTLYQNSNTLSPTRYELKGTFYRQRFGEGRWAIVRGTKTNPAAVVYQLEPDGSQGSLFLLKADDNILFFLDNDRNLMVGDADFSYTLNRLK